MPYFDSTPQVILIGDEASAAPLAVSGTIASGTPGLLLAGYVSNTLSSSFMSFDSTGRLRVSSSFPAAFDQGASGSVPWKVEFYSGSTQIGVPLQPVWITGSTTVTNANQTPLNIIFGISGSANTLPKLINLYYNKSDGAIVANVFKRVITYTAPTGFSGYIAKFTSYQAETAASRLVYEINMSQLSIVTNVFTAGSSYTNPLWTAAGQAEVTTGLSAGAGNVVVTITYTNESGTGSRSGTITIPKGSAVGSRWDIVLQGTDLGIQSIQNLSVTPTLAAGVIKVLGLVQLSVHEDQSTNSQTDTQYPPGMISFPSGTVMGIEYSGGTVSKQRIFDALIQLY